MEQDPYTERPDGAPSTPYHQAWEQYAPQAQYPEPPPGQVAPPYQPEPPLATPSMPLPSSPYAPPSQPYAGYPGYPGVPGYGWPANATAPLSYGYPAYPGYPGYQAPAPPAPRRGLPVWAVVLISMTVALVIAAGVLGALAALLPAEAGTFTSVVSSGTLATPTASPLAIANGRTFTDPLNGTANTGWQTSSYCFFKDGAYHVTPNADYGSYTCFAPAGSFSDFDMHVSAQEISGPLNYGYGLSFRRQSPHDFYTFVVASNGEAWFGKYVSSTFQRISPFWSLSNFTEGLNANNTLRVTAQETTFTFYVNDVQAGSVTDTTYSSGMVGVYAGDTNLEAAFSNFSITGAS